MGLHMRVVLTLCLLLAWAPFVAAQDTDSGISASATLTEPTTISSVAAGFTNVLDFTITDSGSADGLATEVTQVVIHVSGTGSAADHTWRLNGAGVVNAIGTVGVGTITFSGLTASVANGTPEVYTLSLDLATTPAGTPDNSTFILSLDSTDFTVSGATSSNFTGATTGPVDNGSGLTYQVAATKIRVFSQPGASQTVGSAFACSVEYTDAGDNRDLDIGATDIVTATRSDAGAITSGATAVASSGLATFSINCGMPGNLVLSLSFADNVAGSVDFSASPVSSSNFALVAADDANSTVSAGPLSEPTSIVSTNLASTDVFDFTITDLATSDGKVTAVTQVVIHTGGTGTVGDHTWRLNGPDAANVLGTVGVGTITFSGLSISVANGGNEAYVLRLTLAATPASTQDNQTFTFSISNVDFTLGGTSTSFAASAPVANSGLAYTVDATKIRVFANPGATQNVGVAFGCSVEFTDINNNRDRDITDSIDATRNDAGAVTSGGTAAAVNGLATFSINCGMPGNPALTLAFTDQAGGTKNFSGSPVNSTAFNLIAGDDANSTLTAGVLSEPTSIVSTNLASTDVFDFTITDLGTSDGKVTAVTQVVISTGGSGTFGDHTWRLNGPDAADVLGTVGVGTITFSGLSISVANGGNETYVLRLALATTPASTQDNQNFTFSLAPGGLTLGGTSTSFAASGPITNGGGLNYTVAASKARIVTNPSSPQNVGTAFGCSVEYTDVNNNRDRDITDDIDALRTDAGAITSGGTATAINGLATFSITCGMPGRLGLTLQFRDQAAGAVNFFGAPVTSTSFNLVAADDANSTIAEGAAGAASLPSTSGLTNVFNLTVTDLATSDAKATIITDITYNITISGGSDDALDFNWQLFNGSGTFSPSATTATTVSFSSATLISVANGGSGTLTLRAQVNTASATIDNKTIGVNVTSAGITTSATGTSVAAAQSVTKAANTTVSVIATQIQIVQQPGASESVGVSFQVTVQYADAQGNRDLNAADIVSVVRNDAGAITLPSPAQATAASGLATFNMTLGLPGNLSGTLQLTYTDLAGGGFNFSGSPKNTSAFLLTASNDANSTISENPAGPLTLSSIAALSAVFSVRVTDLGTSDGLPTTVNGVTFTVTVSGGSDTTAQFTWQLFNGTSTFAPSGTTATTVSFASTPLISVANNANGTLTLRAQVTGASATLDNKTLDIQVTTASFAIAGGSTGLAASQTVNNATNTQVTVAATELQFIGVPPTGAAVNTTIPVSLEYTDVNGNRDLNVSGGPDSVTATWSGAGAVTNGTMSPASGVCNFGTNNLRLQAPGTLGGTLTFTDNGAGVSAGFIDLTPFDLTDLNDANSAVQAGPAAEPSTVTSITAGFTNVFDFKLRDFGTSDGLPTLVTQIVVSVSGTANAGEHIWRLNGPAVSNVVGAATATTITFSGLAINVPNGGNQDFTLSLQLATAPTLTTDNTTFVLSLPSSGVTTSGASTTFGVTSTNNGAGLTYTVAATRLTVTTQPGASQVEGVGFDVRVAYTDINGNIDVNVTDSINSMARSDAGSIQAPTFPRAAVNGVVAMTGANQVRLGLPAAASINLSFTDNAGGTLTSAVIATNNFALTDNSAPTVSSALLQLGPDPRGRTVRVSFSEPLKASSAVVLTNYTLSFAGLHPTSITQPTTSQVDLVFPDYAVASLDTLAIDGVQDVANNTMAPVAAQAITSTDVTAPTLVSITYNDSDGSASPTAGDQYLFLFNEAVNDRIFSGGTTANTALNPAGLSYGTPNSVSFGDDQGLATDSRLVIVTLVAGLTITGSETITLSGITDLAGNNAAATALTLTVIDNISPRLVLTRLDDRDNNGNASIGDVLHVYFSEAINLATMPLVNTTGQMDLALGVSGGGSFGLDATAVFVPGNKELLITLGTGSPSIVGRTLNPPASVTDPAGNPDATSPAVAVATGTSDIFAPNFTLAYSATDPNAVPAGALTITATFTDTQPTTPTIAINQPGLNDLAATNMTSVGGSTRIWSFNWNVSFADGTINIDGINVVTIVGRPTDLRGNALVPASNNTFKTDTTNPAFASVVITDPDNFYRSGDTISLLATLNETGLSVTANLSVVDGALGTQVAFTDNLDGTYSLTSPALSAATLIEGSNIPITVRARDAALNTSTVPVLVNIDDTAPTASLLYDQPSAAVGAGNLTITLSLSEPSPTVPTIAISGLSGTPAVAATPMTGSAGQSSYTFVLNVINPTTGTATVVIANVSDFAGNVPASVSNSSFTVDTQGTVLVANAGPDQNITLPRQVSLSALGSTGPNRTYVWVQDSGPVAVTITGATSATPSFYLQVAGAYVFRVTVTSGANSADDTVTATLLNTLPYVDAGLNITLDQNDVVAGDAAIGLAGSAFDVNGDSLFITWSLLSSPASGNLVPATPGSLATALNVLGGAPIVAGVYRFQLSVNDPLGFATPSTDTIDVIVLGPGVSPPFANAGPDLTASVGQSVALPSLGSGDIDGSLVAYQWRPISRPAGSVALPTGAASATAQFTPDKAGVYQFGLRVIDNANLVSTEDTLTVVVHDLRSATFNRVPRASAALSFTDTDANNSINVGEAVTITGAATDADAETVTLTLREVSGPEALLILDPNALQSTFTPGTPGVYVLRLEAQDAAASGLWAELSFVVAPAAALAPVALAALDAADDADLDDHVLFIPGTGVDNQLANPAIDLDGTASTGTGLTFSWRQVAGPTAALASVTQSGVSFVPTVAGTYVFELSVTDGTGLASSTRLQFAVDTYDVTANPTGKAVPRANAGADVSSAGGVVILGASATDADTAQGSLTFHWVQVGGAPIILDTTVGAQPRFTPPVAGTYVFELYVSDGNAYSLADSVTVTDTSKKKSGGNDGGSSCATSESVSLFWLVLALGCALFVARMKLHVNKLALLLIVALGAVFTLGCGPVALALEGGTAGGFLGFQKKEEEKKSNSAPVVILNALTREDAPAAINYSLLDSESNTCSVTVQYRVGSGAFADCTQGAGGDSTTALASSQGGTPHVFKWDFVADLGSTSLVSNISIRVAANDGRQGGFSQLDNLAIGNDAPTVSGIASSESSGLFLVTFSLADSSADVGSMTVAYSIDQAQTWTDLNPTGSDFFGNPPLNLLSSPGGTPAQFIWNSPVALPNFVGDVFLRLVPSDMPLGYTAATEGAAVVHGPIQVSNTANTGPRLSVLTPLTGSVQANRVHIEFTLADDQSDPGEVFVEWSLDGLNFSPANLANQAQLGVAGPFVTNPAPSRYELVWEALVDFLATAPNTVFLRLTPRDSVAGFAQVFGPLTVFGNTAPEVRAISVSGNAGLVQITVKIADANSDRVSIAPEMIIGGTPTALTSTDFGGADLTNLRSSPSGEENILVWNTSLLLPGVNQPTVNLRITPTDLPATLPGTTTLTGAAFTSDAFAVINDPGSAAPAQVTIACTVPANATTIVFGDAYGLTATVLPAPAAQSVNWSVDEGPAYGNMVPWFSPATGVYFAPPSPPAAFRPYVTLRARCAADPNVTATYRLYWGTPPGSVSVTPASQTVLLGDSLRFSAGVAPGSAPQIASWKVVEGSLSGSIDADGTYHAPAIMPPSTTVTIRATAVSGVSGSTTLTLAPRPNRVVVSTPASSLALDATLQFSAQVNPFPESVQAVRWRVVFDGEDRGSGDAGVGTISPTGLYTAPHFLPRPITVQIEASSNALPAVSGRTTITLVAPLPSSFDVTPPTATLIAGGSGQQFTLANLLPDNASSAVVWTRSPALGTVDTEGRYTPPASLIVSTVVLVTATSAVSGSVTASASVTLQPQTGDIPVSVTILPNTPSVAAGGAPIRFVATVSPSASPQAVSWRVVSGGGSINASGVYTPPSVATDTQVTIRATSDANGAVFDEYVLSVAGSGGAWFEAASTAIGRDQPSGFYDAINNFFWVIGGKSEASGALHDTGAFAYDLATNQWRSFPPVGDAAYHNTISVAQDEDNERIIAVVGDGIASVKLFTLALNPPGSSWAALTPGGASNAPVLPENFRYLTFWDRGGPGAGDETLVVIKDGALSHMVYRLDTSTDAWLAPVSVPVTSAPKEPHACAYVYDSINNRHFLFGEPGVLSPSSGLFVWRLNTPAMTFTAQAQTGSVPAGFLNGAQAAFDSVNSLALVFGGDRGTAGFSSSLLTLDLNTVGLAAWGAATLSGEAVPARAYGAFMATGTRALLFGGKNGKGGFGDLWDFNLTSLAAVTVAGLSPIDFVPQGRRWAASAWVASLDEGYFFGGETPHGESSELWALQYDDGGVGSVSWSRVAPLGTLPSARAGASLVLDVARNRLILFGGFAGGTVLSDVHAFDLASRQWSLLAPLGTPPSGRWSSAVCIEGNRMFVYGGKQDADTVNFSTGLAGDVHVLDFTAGVDGVWTQPATFSAPDARMGATAGFEAATGRLLIHGGYTQASQANGQLYALDLLTGLWGAPGIANASFQPGVFDSACAYAAAISRFISAPHGAPQAQSLVVTAPKANWQNLTAAAGAHAAGANGLYDEANSRFIVAFGSVLQYGVEAGTNRVSVIEFK